MNDPSATSTLAAAPAPPHGGAIGCVLAVSGASGRVLLDRASLAALATSDDRALASAGQVGGQVKVRAQNSWLIATVRALAIEETSGTAVIAEVDFLGEGGEERVTGKLYRFRRGVTRYPIPGDEVEPVTTADLRQVYATDRAAIEIGTVYPTSDVRASIGLDALLGRHFALVGSTGTGKSTAIALLLHRICAIAPHAHIVMIDPHGEYGAAFKASGELFDVANLQIPYWLMNFEEHCEVFLTSRGSDRQIEADILAKCLLAARAKSRLGQETVKLTVDAPIPYVLSDLTQLITQDMGKIDRAGDVAPFLRLKSKIDEIKGDPRYGFMFSGMLVADTMARFLARVFRMPGDGRPISIVDLSGVPSEITAVVVALLSRMIFDFALWSRGEPRRPILLVCEEAHRYVPQDSAAAPGAVGRVLGRIAKEGRKYGVSLGLVTQRPSDLSEAVLSQCGTIMAMRLNNERDQGFVRAAMPEGARGFIDTVPALRNRECILSGEGVSVPVRVSFDTLDEHRRPASGDPAFSNLWSRSGDEDEVVASTVRRWRAQGR